MVGRGLGGHGPLVVARGSRGRRWACGREGPRLRGRRWCSRREGARSVGSVVWLAYLRGCRGERWWRSLCVGLLGLRAWWGRGLSAWGERGLAGVGRGRVGLVRRGGRRKRRGGRRAGGTGGGRMLRRRRTSIVGLRGGRVSWSRGLAGSHGGGRRALAEGWPRGSGVGSAGGGLGAVWRSVTRT